MLFLLGFGCTRLIHFYSTCESDTECAQAFGEGSTCLSDGYCSLGDSDVDTADTHSEDIDTGESIEEQSCTTHRECRGINGWGSICNDDGTCSESEISELPARCVTYPSDAFENPSEYSSAHIVGAIADGSLEMLAKLAIEMATEEINDGVANEQFVTFLCDNRNDADLPVYNDGLDSIAATQLVSTFLITDLHAPVVVGPGISETVHVAVNSTSNSDSVFLSTAGGDGLTRLTNDGRIWSSVGDDRHRLKTLIEYLNFVESYSHSLIVFDRPELLSCAAGPNGAVVHGCQLPDEDELYAPDDLQTMLYGLDDPMYQSVIFPHFVDSPAASQIWFDYLQYNTLGPTAFVFLSDNINTNIDFVSQILPSISLQVNDIDFYFSQYALQSSFIEEIPMGQPNFFRGFTPGFDDMDPLFSSPGTGFYQRFFDASNGLDAGDNPQSLFVYDSMMLAYLALLHSDKAGDKGSGNDISNMLRTFKSFDDAGSEPDEIYLTPEGIEASMEMASDSFSLVGLSGQVRYTAEQDASIASSVWEIAGGQLSYVYECANTLSVLQDMVIDCEYD